MLRYRFLFEQLVRRELRQKYKGSALGVAWYLVNPLVLMGAYWLMFGKLLPVRSSPNKQFIRPGAAGCSRPRAWIARVLFEDDVKVRPAKPKRADTCSARLS